MNKNEIGIIIANKLDNEISKKDIATVINAFIDTVKETLVKGDKITIEGFISFSTMIIDEKSGTCFGKDWKTPKKFIPTVKYSNSFKKQIANNKI